MSLIMRSPPLLVLSVVVPIAHEMSAISQGTPMSEEQNFVSIKHFDCNHFDGDLYANTKFTRTRP